MRYEWTDLDIKTMLHAMMHARNAFMEYARLHLEKGTAAGMNKAATNAAHAASLQRVIESTEARLNGQ